MMLTIQILPVLQRTAVMMRLEREREAMMAVIVKMMQGHCLMISLIPQTRR